MQSLTQYIGTIRDTLLLKQQEQNEAGTKKPRNKTIEKGHILLSGQTQPKSQDKDIQLEFF